MQLDITYDDPGTFDAPLHAAVKLEYAVDDEILELVCNEASEGGVKHWVGDKTSDNSVTAVDVDSKLLAKYVGTYKGYWLDNMTTVEVTLKDGALVMRRNGGKRIPADRAVRYHVRMPQLPVGSAVRFRSRGRRAGDPGLRDSGLGRVDLQARAVTTGEPKVLLRRGGEQPAVLLAQ